jgi:cytochrome c553
MARLSSIAFLLVMGAASADGAEQDRLAPCLACHGATGQSQAATVPSLGGQPAKYSLIQLYMFREGLRLGAPMNDLTKQFSDDDLTAISDALAKLPAPQPSTETTDPQRVARGKALTEQYHCNVCHRDDFSGQENVPRLAGQREDYLLKALTEYKTGARHGYDATMAEALQPVDKNELGTLAYFLARVR